MRFYILGIVLLVAACTETGERAYLQGDAFGTTYNIQYETGFGDDLGTGIDSVIFQINRSVSTYMPNSDISKINQGDSTLVVDETFKDVYLLSERVYNESGGYFDPTIGVLRNAYGFGDVSPLPEIDEGVLDSLMQYVGFGKVELTPEGNIKKLHPQIYFDFNAIAKGYGIDRLGSYLDSQRVENYLIELGGELLAKGINPESGEPWKVGIESVDSQLGDRSFNDILKLKDRAMASSGNYRKFRIDPQSGKKYVHTINPLNGKAEQSDITSATVLAPTCAEADAYATAFMALGLERAKQLLNSLNEVDAYLTYNDARNSESVYMTSGFEKVLQD